jgi:hypothetical protein
MTQPRLRMSGVVIGAPNPPALAAFNQRLLGRPLSRDDEVGTGLRPYQPRSCASRGARG